MNDRLQPTVLNTNILLYTLLVRAKVPTPRANDYEIKKLLESLPPPPELHDAHVTCAFETGFGFEG